MVKYRENLCNVKKYRVGDVQLSSRHLKAEKKLLSGGADMLRVVRTVIFSRCVSTGNMQELEIAH